MNCAKCSNPTRNGGRTPKNLRLGVDIKLERIGEVGNCDRYRCPLCRSIFLFTKRHLQPAAR